jgi:endo-1,3(4)-beta-glucanase
MDGQTAQGSDLLMMGFDATHIPSLQNASKVDGLTYRSNMGTMSAVAGGEWKQKLDIPKIMQNGATGEELWMGSGKIKAADAPRIRQSLEADTALLTDNFLGTCNADSYICGKYLHNVARLALIAENLGEFTLRNKLTDYLKKSLALWLDGVKPDGTRVDPATDKANDTLVYDTTNGGTITSLGLQDPMKDYSNRAYIDHMFHYGYYIYAAAVVAALDPERDTNRGWLALNSEKVNLLARDIANPSLDDPYFPIVRTFDWFRMQNIADTGPDANGGNTESSSESVNSNYALATWGVVTKNDQFQALAAIMTAAEIRTSKAFYQVTPETAYVKAMDFPEVDVTVKLPKNRSEIRKIAPGSEPVMNILRANIVETNTFFGPLLANRIGINLLPISPMSEYLISKDWANVHYDTLRRLEDTNTAQFNSIINTPPNQGADCFLAGWDPKAQHLQPDGTPEQPNPGAVCAGRLRVLYSWRQLPVAASGMIRPAEAYQRYVAYMDGLKKQQDDYQLNTRSSVYPDSSLNRDGVVADVLKDISTPSTDTNTLWWLSARKPN